MWVGVLGLVVSGLVVVLGVDVSVLVVVLGVLVVELGTSVLSKLLSVESVLFVLLTETPQEPQNLSVDEISPPHSTQKPSLLVSCIDLSLPHADNENNKHSTKSKEQSFFILFSPIIMDFMIVLYSK